MSEENRWLTLALVCMGALLVLLYSVKISPAHENPTDWIGIERRTNAAGVLCCGQSDCKSFTKDQVTVSPEGYLFPDGEMVPFGKAAPSIDSLYWKCSWGNETKCVFAPMGMN